MNTRPPTTVGCARTDVAFGQPNPYLSVSFDTLPAGSPAWLACWKRVFERPAPHPFHRAPFAGSKGGVALHVPAPAAPPAAAPGARPVRYSATALRSAADSS